MGRYALLRERVLIWAYLFHWAYADDFKKVIGIEGRSGAFEYNLPVLVRKKKLKVKRWGKKLIYSLPGVRGLSDYHVQHGLKCTEALIRFHLSKEGEYVSERYFKASKYRVIPEWGVVYGDVMFLFEYSTADNFKRKRLIEKKIDNYRENLGAFRKEFSAEPYLVFVIDTHQKEIELLGDRYDHNNFYFTTAEGFYSVEETKQLASKIYRWRGEYVSL